MYIFYEINLQNLFAHKMIEKLATRLVKETNEEMDKITHVPWKKFKKKRKKEQKRSE